MKNFFPFSDYDFWAYLTSGFVLIYVVDHEIQLRILTPEKWDLPRAVMVIAIAYIVGQIIAGFAATILERMFVHRLVGNPRSLLLGHPARSKILANIFWAYSEPLPSQTQKAIRDRAKRDAVSEDEAIFWLAYSTCRSNETSMLRLNTFQNLSGLARNLSLTMLLCVPFLVYSGFATNNLRNFFWAAGALFASVGMFFRYLKFYRHYTAEVFTTFAF